MPKPNMLRSHLYRLLVCLSVITLLTGQAAAPADDPTPTPTATPPTPAQEAWQDWSERSAPSIADFNHVPNGQAGTGEASNLPESTLGMDYCPNYPRYEYTAALYSMMQKTTNWDEEIYRYAPLCDIGEKIRLTTSPGADYEPQLSRDKQRIAFVSDRNSTSTIKISNIYTMSINGENLRRATTTPTQDRMPSFSPDGTKIVFVSTRDGNPEIYVMNSDGTNQVRLTKSPEVDVEPDWSPDGKRIAWVRRTTGSDLGTLYTMNPDGTGVTALVSNKPFIGQPRWSPSGTRLMFRYSADTNNNGWYRLAIVNSNGSGLTVYFPRDFSIAKTDYEPGGWLPDERGIIYSATEYVYYEGEWYIESSTVYKSLFGSMDPSTPLTSTEEYAFTPHSVSYENIPPIARLEPLPEYSRRGTVKINWSVSDDYPGVSWFQIYYKTDSDPKWKFFGAGSPNAQGTTQGTYNFPDYVTGRVYLRIQASDRAGNLSPLSAYDASTQIFSSIAYARAVDARKQPVGGATVTLSPQPLNNPVTGQDGKAVFYVPEEGDYQAQFSKPGYATSPNQKWNMLVDQSYMTVMTGPDEQFENRDFEEESTLQSWQTSGAYIYPIWYGWNNTYGVHIGKYAKDPFSLYSPTPLPDVTVVPQAIAYDDQARLHILYNDNQYGIFGMDGVIEPWPALPVANANREIKFNFAGQPYLSTPTQVIQWNGSEWTVTTVPIPAGAIGKYAIDPAGKIHAIFSDAAAQKVKYTHQAANGTWLPTKTVNTNATPNIAISVEPDGSVHLAESFYGIFYQKILPDGITVENAYLSSYSVDVPLSLHYVPGRGTYLTISGGVYQYRNSALNYLMGGEGTFASFQYDEGKNLYLFTINTPTLNPFKDVKLQVLPINGPKQSYSFKEEVPGILFEVKADGTPFLIHGKLDQETTKYYYRTGSYEQLREINGISQPIALEAGMHMPTLSFFYRITSPNEVTQSTLEAVFTPDGGEPVTVFQKTAVTTTWTHAWADLTPYQGQQGTLSFQVVQAAGELPVYALIDETSVASLPTPILQSINPSSAAYPVPAETWIDLNGQNLWNGAVISIDGAQVTQVEYVDETHIRFLAPEALSLGMHLVKVANPGGGESWITLYVGTPVFIPLTRR